MLGKAKTKFTSALEALEMPVLLCMMVISPLRKVVSMPDSNLSNQGKMLKAMCISHLNFYNHAVKMNYLTKENGQVASSKGFLSDFKKLYEEESSF
jgi:hypothetical protein